MAANIFQQQPGIYDALIDWPKRLANETPFYRSLFERYCVRRVLDVACGSGHHAAMFHEWGLDAEGSDGSPAMIALCRSRCGESPTLRWSQRAFDEPQGSPGSYDAAICVGNSLALAPDLAAVERVIGQMLAAVRADGVCLWQVVNLWHLPDGPCVWQKCKRVSVDGQDMVLVKGIHRAGERGFVELVAAVLTDDAATPTYETVTFLGLQPRWLMQVAERCGARRVACFGNYQQSEYQVEKSPDIVLVAEK